MKDKTQALDEVLFDIRQCEDVLCEANTDPHDYALAKAGIHHLWRARLALQNNAPDTGYRQRCLAYAAMNAVRSDEAEISAQLEIARDVMARNHNVLGELAKGQP